MLQYVIAYPARNQSPRFLRRLGLSIAAQKKRSQDSVARFHFSSYKKKTRRMAG